MKSENLFIINGVGTSGKDTFVEYVNKHSKRSVFNIRSSDHVKHLASEYLGWDGKKDDRGRRFLAELMTSMKNYNDGIFKHWCEVIDQVEEDSFVVFLHVRESDEIKKYVDRYGCKTILIKREGVEVPDNDADRDVYNTKYDITINNDGSKKELEEKAFYFAKYNL